jgi:drug/metabolite transporter (DMT)-like permease
MTAPTSNATATPRAVLAAIVLVAALIGANFSVIKLGLDHTTPMLFTSGRAIIGGTFLIALALARRETIPTDPTILKRIFVVGLSITTISSGLLVYGISRVPAGFAALISSTTPLFVACLSFFILGSRVTRIAAGGLMLGFIGTAVLASPSLSGAVSVVGVVSLIFSALAWSYGIVFMKWKDFSAVSPIMLVGVQLIMSACLLLPFALITEGTADTDWSWGLFGPLLYAAIPSSAITFALLALVVRKATPTQAASTAYMIPVFGVVFAWLIRDEVLRSSALVGGVLVLIGVSIVVTAGAKSPATN